jgi:hypothetical protein
MRPSWRPRKAASHEGLARTACAQKPCRKLHHGGQTVGAVAAVGKRAEFARYRPVDLSMEGALGSQPRGVGAPREDVSSAPRCPTHFGGAVPGRDRERQRYVCSARGVPKKHARVGCAQNASQSSTQRRESKTQRSWCTRRPIAAPPGAGRAGNSIPASATKSPLSARVSARVLGRLAEAPIGIAQATSSGVGRSVGARGNQSAAEIAKGHLASPRRRLRANGS